MLGIIWLSAFVTNTHYMPTITSTLSGRRNIWRLNQKCPWVSKATLVENHCTRWTLKAKKLDLSSSIFRLSCWWYVSDLQINFSRWLRIVIKVLKSQVHSPILCCAICFSRIENHNPIVTRQRSDIFSDSAFALTCFLQQKK